MSILGNLLLEAVSGLHPAGGTEQLESYALIAAISVAVWLCAYHLWIKHGIPVIDKIVLAIGTAGVGLSLFIPFFGLFFVLLYGWVFLVVSLMTAMLLSFVARHDPGNG